MALWSLAYATHHVDGSQPRSCLGLPLGVAHRLVVIGALGGEQGRVDQGSHEDGVDDAEEIPDLMSEEGSREGLYKAEA